jgi:hypothetical protein
MLTDFSFPILVVSPPAHLPGKQVPSILGFAVTYERTLRHSSPPAITGFLY